MTCVQPLTIFQRSLTTMQIQIQGLLQFAVPLFPTAEVSDNQETSFRRERLACLTRLRVCAEGPPGRPASAELLRGQSAPADRPAGLQGAE